MDSGTSSRRQRPKTSTGPTLRGYRPGQDATATLQVFQLAILQTASKDYEPEQVTAWAGVGLRDLTEWDHARSAAHTVVATIDDRLVGFADFTDDGVLDMLFVHPDEGGRGIARRLVTRVQHAARRAGLRSLRTFASRSAQPAFTRLGFTTVEYRPTNTVRGVVVPNSEMRCDLAVIAPE